MKAEESIQKRVNTIAAIYFLCTYIVYATSIWTVGLTIVGFNQIDCDFIIFTSSSLIDVEFCVLTETFIIHQGL